MAQYRLSIKIIHKGDIIQKASNNSCMYLHNDLTNRQTKNNGGHEKAEQGVAGGIELPKGVPEEYRDREHLGNTLAKLEKQKNGCAARSGELNLPIELKPEEGKNMCSKLVFNLSQEGMIVDWHIYNNGSNPHMLMLTSTRKYNTTKNKFDKKAEDSYECICKKTGAIKHFSKVKDIKKGNEQNPNNKFERQPLLDKNGNQKYRLKKGKTKNTKDWLWNVKKVDLTGGNHKQNLRRGRKMGEEIGNKALKNAGLDVCWMCESYKTLAKQQGLPEDLALEPTLHMGDKAFQLEQKEKARCEALGIEYKPCTRIGQINQKIR